MVLELAPSPQTQTVNGTATHLFPDVCEVVVFCHGCKTLETLWFNNGISLALHCTLNNDLRKPSSSAEQSYYSQSVRC